jgi:hypothetical protein
LYTTKKELVRMSFIIHRVGNIKTFQSKKYNYIFNDSNGVLARWGETRDDDPQWSPFGPELADIEISKGKCIGCPFCYKGNGTDQKITNMTLDQFKIILNKIGTDTLTQIAFGICDIDTNPDMWNIFEYSRKMGIIPNYTCNGFGITETIAKKTAELCGSVAVSIVNPTRTYEAIQMFVKNGCRQVNIHYMLSKQTFEQAFEVVNNVKNISGFQAIVFLQYKPKGRNKNNFDSLLDTNYYRKLIDHCDASGVNYGFDSCSCHLYMDSIKDKPNKKLIDILVEPCESSCFSTYINCEGIFFPCSFLEGEGEWKEGLNVLTCESFNKDIWMHPKTIAWRNKLLSVNRRCPYYFQEVPK